METFFVDDGMEFNGVIAAVPGVHAEVKFTYRPSTLQDRMRYQSLYSDPDRATAFSYDLLAKHLKSWSLGCPTGTDQIRRLRPRIVGKMIDIILEYAGSDQEAADVKN